MSDDDNGAVFSAVLGAVRLDRLLAFCTSIRNRSIDNNRIEPTEIGQALFGSFHVLFPVVFQDGVRWLLKVPACGTPVNFDSSAAVALRSEALTMRLIRRETSIPVPDVLAFDASLENELGCPFILMSFIEGISLYDCWFDKTISINELRVRRSRVLKDLAQAMAKLCRLSFDNGGFPTFDEHENLTGVGPMRCVDHRRMFDRAVGGSEDGNDSVLYFDAGPFPDPISFYLLSISQETDSKYPLHLSLRQLLHMFLNWIPELEDQRQKFVLTHPDLDIQNVLVSADGHLQGLIDWDGVAAVPRSVGNEKYPSWLTRDWDPIMYGWNEDMERGIEPAGVWEDSPETLARHRKEYENFMCSQLGSEQDWDLCPSTPCSLTMQSLFVENLLIAAENTSCRFDILEKFVITIGEVLRDNPHPLATTEANSSCSSSTLQTTSIDDFGIFDICEALEDGKFTEQHSAVLRKGFVALLNRS